VKGIFVDGKPIEEVLGMIKDEETKNDFNETIEGIQKTLWKPTVPAKPKPFYAAHSRVRKLTPQQIRKEYGIMSKPLNSLIERILFFLETEGSQRVVDLSKKMQNHPTGSISGSLTALNKVVPESICKNMEGRWTIKGEHGADKIYELYNLRKNKGGRRKELPPFDSIPEKPVVQTVDFSSIVKALEKEFHVKVTVEGSIKITFGFEK